MAKQSNPQTGFRKDTTTIITDMNGDTILEVGMQEYTIKHSDGSRTHRRISQSVQLVCHTIWDPSMRLAKPPVHVGVCDECRKPSLFHRRSHGLVALHKAKLCVDGGELCCPLHRRLGSDQKWRCPQHHKTHQLKSLFRPIFFERKD